MPQDPSELGQKTPKITQAIEQTKKGAENNGFDKSGTHKNLEYLERIVQALTKQKKGDPNREDPARLMQSLEQFSQLNFRELAAYARKYRMPALFQFIKPDATPNFNALAELALVTRAVPLTETYKFEPQTLGDMTEAKVGGETRIVFGQIPQLGFSADKIVTASLTSKDKQSFFYPHFDANGNLVSTSEFKGSPYQIYLVEKKAREILADKSDLKQLYPDKVVFTRWGNTTITQQPNGSADIKMGPHNWHSVDALIGFPVPNTNIEQMDIFRRETDMTAGYNPETKGMIIGDHMLDIVDNPDQIYPSGVRAMDIARMVARHEVNHAVWDKVDRIQMKQIVAMFDQNDPSFKQFMDLLFEHPSYLTAATNAAKFHGVEKINWEQNGRIIEVGKEQVINELVAYGTWDEVIDASTMTKMNQLNDQGKPKNPLPLAATTYLNKLKPEQLKLLQDKLLKGDSAGKDAEKLIEPIIVGARILAARRKKNGK